MKNNKTSIKALAVPSLSITATKVPILHLSAVSHLSPAGNMLSVWKWRSDMREAETLTHQLGQAGPAETSSLDSALISRGG